MKKILVLFMLLALCSCSKKNDSEDADYLRYQDSLMLIENAVSFVDKSDYFNFDLEVTTSDAGYQYYLIIDEPRNAMYNVSLIATIDGVTYDDNTMAPNFGIFGNESINLIPNQIYTDGGYAKGVVINGISETDNFTVKALVSWTDETNETTYYEYITIDSYQEVGTNE